MAYNSGLATIAADSLREVELSYLATIAASRSTLYAIPMTLRNYISALTICVLTLAVLSCKTEPKLTFKVTRLDTTVTAVKVPISELADNYKKYHGLYIETTGIFHQGFEDFAISTDKNLLTGAAQEFWLDTHKDLNIDHAFFAKMNRKQVTIKGLIDTTRRGHLGSYLATITNIYYWQQ